MSILIKNVLLDGKQTDIFIEKNLIKKIQPKIAVKAEYKIDGSKKAAVPSFINAHTHAAMTLLRGYADDMQLDAWLNKKIWPLEAKMTEKSIYAGTKLACLEMIKSGSTFFNDMYWHYHGIARAVEETGIRAGTNALLLDLFDSEKAKEQIRQAKTLFAEAKKYSERVIFTLALHTIYTVSEESFLWAKDFAQKNDLLLHIHVSETKKEVDDCIKKHKLRPVEYLHKLGFLGRNVIAAHCIWLSNKEIALLKKNNVQIVHNPVSNMKLSSGFFQYRQLKQAGLNICLGTDGAASNNNLDMLESMKKAALLQKFHTMDPTIMPAKEAFDMATINGAKAFRLNCSEIKEGKLADLLLIDLKNVAMVPNHNLISNLVYSANGSCVDTTICDGKILMQNRKVKAEEKIIEEAQKAADDLVRR